MKSIKNKSKLYLNQCIVINKCNRGKNEEYKSVRPKKTQLEESIKEKLKVVVKIFVITEKSVDEKKDGLEDLLSTLNKEFEEVHQLEISSEGQYKIKKLKTLGSLRNKNGKEIGPEKLVLKNMKIPKSTETNPSKLKKFESIICLEHCFDKPGSLKKVVEDIFDKKSLVKGVRIIDKNWTSEIINFIAESDKARELECIELGLPKSHELDDDIKVLKKTLKDKIEITEF